VIYSDELDVDKYESWMTMLLVKITDSKGKTKVYYKWYIPIFSSDENNLKIAAGLLRKI
jgi:hypothetical protein